MNPNKNVVVVKTVKTVANPLPTQSAPTVKLDKRVFEGTVAGQKFLFLADTSSLSQVAEILPGHSAEEIALQNAAELVARARANQEAVKALFKAWREDKAKAYASSPKALAKAQASAEAKAVKAKASAAVKLEKSLAKAAEKAAKLEEKLAQLKAQQAK